MEGEDPLITKKRVEKRYSNIIESRYSKEDASQKQHAEPKQATEIFKPWDDKPDVALAVNQSSPDRKRTPRTNNRNMQ